MEHSHGHDLICNKERTTIPMKDRGVAELVGDMGRMGFQGGQLFRVADKRPRRFIELFARTFAFQKHNRAAGFTFARSAMNAFAILRSGVVRFASLFTI